MSAPSAAPQPEPRPARAAATQPRPKLVGPLSQEASWSLQATALEAAANPVMITDRGGTILWVNPAFTALTGYSAAEAIGRNPRLLQSGRHSQQFYRQFWSTILGGKIWQGEFNNRHKDGRLYYDEHTITPVRANDGSITHFVAVMRDITARKQAEEEIRRLNTELERRVQERTAQLQAANQELEAFAYSVSHDLRAPLRHIAGFLKLLRAETGQDASRAVRHYFERIDGSAKKMELLIEDLLNFSRLSRVELSPTTVPLAPLVEEVIRDLEPETRGRNIHWKQERLPGQVQADAALLRQVLLNLLSNAAKYSRPRDPAEIQIGCREDSPQETVLFVRDNGVGFDMQYAGQLFGVFQRLHAASEFEGTGIGLANVRRIISRHGGRTWAEGELDRGATVYFSLPKI